MKTYFFIHPTRITIIRMINGRTIYQDFKARVNLPPDVIHMINDEQLDLMTSDGVKKEGKTWLKRTLHNFLSLLKELFIAVFPNVLF